MEFAELNTINLKGIASPAFAITWSEDDQFFIKTDGDIHLLKLTPHFSRIDDSLMFYRQLIKVSQKSPTGTIVDDYKRIIQTEKRLHIYNIVNDAILSPIGRTIDCNDILFRCVDCCWSPAGLLPNAKCALLILSSAGHVEIRIPRENSWMAAIDISELYTQLQNNMMQNVVTNYSDLQRIAYFFYTTSISWSGFVRKKSKDTYIAMSQGNGDIIIWLIGHFTSSVGNYPTPVLLTKHSSELMQITSMKWCSIIEDKGLLILGSLNGMVKCMILNNINTSVTIDVTTLWPHADDLRVDNIFTEYYSPDLFLIFVVKRFVLVIFLISSSGAILDTKFHRMNNLSITGIQLLEKGSYIICCLTGYIRLLKININEKKIISELLEVTLPISWSHTSLSGVCCSGNRAMWILVVNYCKMTDHLIIREPLQLILCKSKTYVADKLLMSNPTNRLTNFWDCLNVCKIICEKNEFYTSLVGTHSNYDSVPLYLTKLHYWMNIACHNFMKKKKINAHLESLTPHADLESIILAKHSYERLHKLCLDHDKNEANNFIGKSSRYLSTFLRNFMTTRIYDKYFQEETGGKFDILLQKACKISWGAPETCPFCDDEIISDKCARGHPIDCCIISFVPINAVKYPVCEFCKTCAHPDLPTRELLCTFCDTVMVVPNVFDS